MRFAKLRGFSEEPNQLFCATQALEIVQPGDPEPEISLDELDNDCDGSVDELHPDCGDQVGKQCQVGIGRCVNIGNYHCEVDLPGNNGELVCLNSGDRMPVVAGNPIAEIIGNQSDDDCDGTVDERVCDGQNDAPEMPNFLQISAGDFHTCGVADNGFLYCWGVGSDSGIDCMNNVLCFEQARPPGGAGYRQVASGGFHSCAINSEYEIECWGLSEGGRTNPPAGRFINIWAGKDHTCGKVN